jgi:hypothetical protein
VSRRWLALGLVEATAGASSCRQGREAASASQSCSWIRWTLVPSLLLKCFVEMEVGTPKLCDPICSFVLVSWKTGIGRPNIGSLIAKPNIGSLIAGVGWGLGGPGLGCAVAHLDHPVGPPLSAWPHAFLCKS